MALIHGASHGRVVGSGVHDQRTDQALENISLLQSVADAVLDVSLQHHLAAPVKGGLGRVDLSQNGCPRRSSGRWPAPGR